MLEYLHRAALTCFDDSQKWEFKLYEPYKKADSFNLITFFIAEDTVDVTDLQRYRQQTQTECLVAINTTDKNYACLTVADNVIECLQEEVELAIHGLTFMASGGSFIGLDWNDVATAISGKKMIKFAHSYATNQDCVKHACDQLVEKIKDIKLEPNYELRSAMISTISDSTFNYDDQEYITTQIEKNLDVDEANIFYQLYFDEAFKYWQLGEQGCCICLHLIYGDKSRARPPFHQTKTETIEKPKSTQPINNSIEEYLRKKANER